MSKQWRCAVVGTGVVGEMHVRVIPKIPGCTLAAVCDILPEKMTWALDKNKFTGIPQYTDYNEMLRKEKLDVVHVCTPSGIHMDPCIAVMEAGKNVIVEKPMEIALDRIDRMHAVAQKCGVRLAGIFQNRWNDANRAIHQAMKEGRFGTLTWAGCFTLWYRADKYYENGGWRGTWKLDGGGAVMNQSVHAIDLLQWIAGPVKSVSAYASSRIHKTIEVEDTLSASLQFANGAFGSIVGTTGMFPGMPPRLEIGGENGTATTEGGLKMFKFRDERPEDAQLMEKLGVKPASTSGGSSPTDIQNDLHWRNIHDVLNDWEQGRDAETYAPEARKAVAIVLAMYESARQNGAPIKVG